MAFRLIAGLIFPTKTCTKWLEITLQRGIKKGEEATAEGSEKENLKLGAELKF